VKRVQEVMDLIGRFVSRHATLPILENVYIKCGIDTIIFRATDMEKYIEIEVPAQLDDEGVITVNAKTFADILKTIDDDQLTLVIEESQSQMTIISSQDEFKIKWISGSEYVAIPDIKSEGSLQLETSTLVTWIDKVEYAVTEKNFSPVLTGVFIRIKDEEGKKYMIFVGTDSFRLAEWKIPYYGDTNQPFSCIIPKVHINDIKRVAEYAMNNGTENLTCTYANNMVEFTFDIDDMTVMCSCLLIQWSFPDYEQESIIPTTWNTKALVDSNQFDKAIKKIEILTRDMNNYISVKGEGDKILLTSGETDRGHADTHTSALIEGDDFAYGVNGKYISDFLKCVQSDEIIMKVIDGEKPIILRDKEDDMFTYVVRPLVK